MQNDQERYPGALRQGTSADVKAVAEIWYHGWRDGHLGFVPDELLASRTPELFAKRATERTADTTVLVVGDEVAGFVMIVGDEVEQVYVSAAHRGAGVANVLLDEAERQVSNGGHAAAWLAVVAGNARARTFYERQGWADEGLFDYSAHGKNGPVPVPSHRYTKQVRS